MMIRDPRRRVTSAYNYFMHADGMGKLQHQLLQKTAKSPLDFVNFPGIAGCQVRLVANVPLTMEGGVDARCTGYLTL
eukprot:m.34992 g.34992  ORF g.34992 m.34992 type:complete len:77 (-) comp12357_c0_seq7:461-691(-)